MATIKTKYGTIETPLIRYKLGKRYKFINVGKKREINIHKMNIKKAWGNKVSVLTFELPVMTGKFKGMKLSALYVNK